MISFLRGTLKRKYKGNRVVVEANGVGYEIKLPFFVMRTLDGVAEGDEKEFVIYYHVTRDQPSPILIGFNREHEKSFFEKLVKVKGIGPDKAADALVFSVSAVARAIAKGDVEFLTRMQKIGPKTAKKIVAELQDSVAEWALLQDEGYDQVPSAAENALDEAVDVLVGLGYKRTEARDDVETVLRRLPKLRDPQDILREVFRAKKG